MASRADVTVITATIPGRGAYLTRAIESVFAQTRQPEAHLIHAHDLSDGMPIQTHVSHQRNALAGAVQTRWVAYLDDDNYWFPEHIETAEPSFADDLAVIYTFPAEVELPGINCNGWAQDFLIWRLHSFNFIDANCFISMDWLDRVGGWSEMGFDRLEPVTDEPGSLIGGYAATGTSSEDWDLWVRIAEAGGRFRCVPSRTWSYRFDAPDRGSAELWAPGGRAGL